MLHYVINSMYILQCFRAIHAFVQSDSGVDADISDCESDLDQNDPEQVSLHGNGVSVLPHPFWIIDCACIAL